MRWWRRKEREQDLERELRADLELEAAEQQANGLSADDARHAALRAFASVTRASESFLKSSLVTGKYEDSRKNARQAPRGSRDEVGY